MRAQRLGAGVACTVLAIASQGLAQPQFYPGTGHYYEPVLHHHGALSWDNVKAEAASCSFLGVRGHLATITSQEENDFIAQMCLALGYDTGFFIGAYQPPDSPEPAGGWSWITGEPWGYDSWRLGEPNNSGDEYVAYITSSQTQGLLGSWNDITGIVHSARDWSHYVIEYPVPEPTALLLLAIGGLALVRRRE